MSPHRRYQSSTLNFGIGLNNAHSPTSQPITPGEIAVSPRTSYRRIPPKTSHADLTKADEYHSAPVVPSTAPSSHQLARPPTLTSSVPAITNRKGDKTYRVRHHHQNHYEPSTPSSLSQGLFGLPILQDYLKTINRSPSPPPSKYKMKAIEDREWEYDEDLGDTKLLDSPLTADLHHFHHQKETTAKPRMKTTLPAGRPGTPPYPILDEMEGIIQVCPASRSRTRPEQHTHIRPSSATGQKKGARRRVKSTSAAIHSGHTHHRQQAHHETRVSTAVSNTSQEQMIETDPSSMDTMLQDCLNKLKSSDWEEICSAFSKIEVATKEAPTQVKSVLKRIIWLSLRHFSSARTKVSRSACQCFKRLYETQRKSMEGDGDQVFQKLLDLCGGPSNKFIQEEGKAALLAAVQNMDGHKCLLLIEQNGAKHRNGNVREFAAQLLGKVIDRLQVDRIMTNKEYAMKVVPMIVGFLREGQLNTRLNAKECLGKIFDHPQFRTVLNRSVSPENVRHVTDTLRKFRKASHTS